MEKLWHAAALGMMAQVEEHLAGDPAPDDITEVFWQACHGGQRRVAERLLDYGADANTTPGYNEQLPVDIAGAPDTRRENLVGWLRDRGARSAGDAG